MEILAPVPSWTTSLVHLLKEFKPSLDSFGQGREERLRLKKVQLPFCCHVVHSPFLLPGCDSKENQENVIRRASLLVLKGRKNVCGEQGMLVRWHYVPCTESLDYNTVTNLSLSRISIMSFCCTLATWNFSATVRLEGRFSSSKSTDPYHWVKGDSLIAMCTWVAPVRPCSTCAGGWQRVVSWSHMWVEGDGGLGLAPAVSHFPFGKIGSLRLEYG